MIRVKRVPPQKKPEKVQPENRVLLKDCGRAKERTRGGITGLTLESGWPPYNRSFP